MSGPGSAYTASSFGRALPTSFRSAFATASSATASSATTAASSAFSFAFVVA